MLFRETRCLSWVVVAIILAYCLPATAQITFTDATASSLSGVLNDDEAKVLATADFNHDGRSDLFVGRRAPFSGNDTSMRRFHSVLLNENGVLVDRTEESGTIDPSTARDVITPDVNGDGWADVVVANESNQDGVQIYINLRNDASGSWLGFERGLATGGSGYCAVDSGDIDGDGHIDLYVAECADPFVSNDLLLINDGNGGFTNERQARVPFGLFVSEERVAQSSVVIFSASVALADTDSDGDLDIIQQIFRAGVQGGGARILINDGDGMFQSSESIPGDFSTESITDRPAFVIAAGNLDTMSPAPEVYISATGSVDEIWRAGPSVNTIVEGTSESAGGIVKLSDLDGDGFLDVALGPLGPLLLGASCDNDPGFQLFLNPQGDATLSQANFVIDGVLSTTVSPYDYALVDVNSDSCVDIVMGECFGYSVFLQDTGSCNEDTDGDGVFDQVDNCTGVANSSQLDVDLDGYGNACDGDLDQSGFVGFFTDFLGIYVDCFFGSGVPVTDGPIDDPTCEESDLNGDGAINLSDSALFQLRFGKEPGPSGLACAGVSSTCVP